MNPFIIETFSTLVTHEPGSESASINSPDYMVFIKGFEMLQYLLQTLCHDIGIKNVCFSINT